MKKALESINSLVDEGIIRKYAIGGGMGAFFYYEPTTTFDLDVMIILAGEENILDPLRPIYNWAKEHGYNSIDEYIQIEGVPVQFLVAYNDLIVEAVENARKEVFANIETFVIAPEYLIAIMLQTGRAKDMGRALSFYDAVKLDKNLLDEILVKYSLKSKLESLLKLSK